MFVGLHGDETYNILFVETPRKFITAKLSIRKPGSSSQGILLAMMKILALMKIRTYGSKALHNYINKFMWCFHKQNIILDGILTVKITVHYSVKKEPGAAGYLST
jgi:hypothetical protein